MGKKSQETRSDLLVLYIVCFLSLVISVGILHELGMFGDGDSLIGANKVTTAAISVNAPEENQTEQINDSYEDVSSDSGKVVM